MTEKFVVKNLQLELYYCNATVPNGEIDEATRFDTYPEAVSFVQSVIELRPHSIIGIEKIFVK